MKFSSYFKRLSLPLLMKELHEQSARRRTFVLRFVYAILLFFAIGLINVNELFRLGRSRAVSPTSMLGIGSEIFQSILWMQFVGVYLFLPAMVCGVLTVEKERNTLGLLLITKLSPGAIILEKFASRIVPMLMCLLISLPLISFTYALGGLEVSTLFLGLWFLLLSMLQIAALAVLCSAFFSGTVGSFLGTYVLLFVMSFTLPILDTLLMQGSIRSFLGSAVWNFVHSVSDVGKNTSLPIDDLVLVMFFPPLMFQYLTAFQQFWGGSSALGSRMTTTSIVAFCCGVPVIISMFVSLLLARFFLVRRAFAKSTNPILSLFKGMDRLFSWSNRLVGGVVLVQESQRMPDMNPVAWRETAKRSLGQFRYLVRVFVTLEFPTLFLVSLAATGSKGNDVSSGPVSALMFFLWIISIVLIAVTASNLIAGERSRQTLDVLLTTPMSSRDIILEKLRGVRRLMLICAIPLLTCIFFQAWWRAELDRNRGREPFGSVYPFPRHPFDMVEYLVTTLATALILLHLTMWVSFWIGMRMKSTSKAILTTLGIIVAWCILPLMLDFAVITWCYMPGSPGPADERSGLLAWFLDSPAFLVVYAEFDNLRNMHPIRYFPVIVNSLIYGACWYFIRKRVLSRADAGLVRIRAEVNPPQIPVQSVAAVVALPASTETP